MFGKESESTCSRLIHSLAESYHSIPFPPHLTLAGTPALSEREMISSIQEIAEKASETELAATTVRCKAPPYQKLTIEIQKSSGLNRLHDLIDTEFQGTFSKREYPHISLLYSTLECTNLDVKSLQLKKKIPNKVIGNHIALVHCQGTPEEWRVLYKRRIKL